MADEADLANDTAERWLNQALASRDRGPKLVPRGNCYFCEEKFDPADPNADKKLFCDEYCAEDHAREQRLRAQR